MEELKGLLIVLEQDIDNADFGDENYYKQYLESANETLDKIKELVEKLIIPDVVESCVCNNKNK